MLYRREKLITFMVADTFRGFIHSSCIYMKIEGEIERALIHMQMVFGSGKPS